MLNVGEKVTVWSYNGHYDGVVVNYDSEFLRLTDCSCDSYTYGAKSKTVVLPIRMILSIEVADSNDKK